MELLTAATNGDSGLALEISNVFYFPLLFSWVKNLFALRNSLCLETVLR